MAFKNSLQAQRFRRASGYLEMLKSRNSKISSQIVEKRVLISDKDGCIAERLRSSCRLLLKDGGSNPSAGDLSAQLIEKEEELMLPLEESNEIKSKLLKKIHFEDKIEVSNPNEEIKLNQKDHTIKSFLLETSIGGHTEFPNHQTPPSEIISHPSQQSSLNLKETDIEIQMAPESNTPFATSILKRQKSFTEQAGNKRLSPRIRFNPEVIFWHACSVGNLSEILEFIPQIRDVNCPNPSGVTTLSAATIAGHKEVVKLLLAHGCDVNLKDKNGWAPLHYAAAIGDQELCQILVQNKAAVCVRNNENRIPSEICKDIMILYPNKTWKAAYSYLIEEQTLLMETAETEGAILHSVLTLQSSDNPSGNHLTLTAGDKVQIIQKGSLYDEFWLGKVYKSIRTEQSHTQIDDFRESVSEEQTASSLGYIPVEVLTVYPRISQV